MKSLIYTVAIGEDYQSLAAMLKESIYLTGSLAETFILTRPAVTQGIPAKHLKTQIGKHKNLGKYDFVLFLDSDVLVQKNPDPLLDKMAKQPDVIFTQEGRSVVRVWGECFTPEELRLHGDRTHFNSGMVGFTPNA